MLGWPTLTGFAPVSDATVLARLDEPARGHILQLDLRALGITDFGEMATANHASGQRALTSCNQLRAINSWPWGKGWTPSQIHCSGASAAAA